MKKFVLLLAALSLFAVACRSNTTIEGTTTAPPTSQATTENNPTDDGGTADDGDAPADEAEPTVAPAETTAPEPTEAPASDDGGDPAPTEPAAEATAAPAAPAAPNADAAEALQAVVDADDWCQVAAAVETGTDSLDTLNFNDPVELEQGMTQALAVFTASRRLAPAELTGDVDQTITAFTALVTALEAAEWRFVDLDLSIIESFDGPMELATYNIQKYNFEQCGIGEDPGEAPVVAPDGTVETDSDLPEFNGTIREQAIQGLVEAGFAEDEANCIFDRLDFTDPAAFSDTTALLEVFSDCGISLDRLAQLGGG